MKVLIMFAHPNPDSFNGLILSAIEKKLTEKQIQFTTRNLYDDNFNPLFTLNDLIRIHNRTRVEDVAIEQQDIEEADVIIFIYPIWWGGPPAILKGWFDRVFTEGFAYSQKEDGSFEGLLKKKKAMVFSTSGSGIDGGENAEIFDAIEIILVKGILNFCGISDITYQVLHEVPYNTDAARNDMVANIINLINGIDSKNTNHMRY